MRYIILIFCSFVFVVTLAQKPSWIEVENRLIDFPEDKYLVAYGYSPNTNNEDPGKFTDKLIERTKNNLVQSIQVSVSNVTQYVVENYNSKTQERFQASMVSFSGADLSGLKIEHFYYKRKKEAYALVYLEKKQFIAYQKERLDQNIEKFRLIVARASDDNLRSEVNLLEDLFAFKRNVLLIEQSQAILLALGVKDDPSLKLNEFNTLHAKFESNQQSLIYSINDKLQSISITPNTKQIEVKQREETAKSIEYRVESRELGVVQDVPLEYWFNDGSRKKVYTNASGKARVFIPKIMTDKKVQFLHATMDLPEFLGFSNMKLYEDIKDEFSKPTSKVVIKVRNRTIVFESAEKVNHKALATQIVGPRVQAHLTEKGFAYSDDLGDADYYIQLTANARNGKVFEGIYFSYAEANISITDLKTGEEVYKESYANVKGGGNSFQNACMKALEKVAEEVLRTFPEKL